MRVQVFGGVLVAAGVVVGLVALVRWFVASARSRQSNEGGVADVSVGGGVLTVVPRGPWKLLSFALRMEIPLERIAGCRADGDPFASHPVAIRIAGTALPGWGRAGYMIGEDGRSWWVVRPSDAAVVIELAEGPLAYLVVGVDDPRATALLIRQAVSGGGGSSRQT